MALQVWLEGFVLLPQAGEGGSEAIPPEAPKPVRCCFKGKKVRFGIKKLTDEGGAYCASRTLIPLERNRSAAVSAPSPVARSTT
jgi:hypothetical protein